MQAGIKIIEIIIPLRNLPNLVLAIKGARHQWHHQWHHQAKTAQSLEFSWLNFLNLPSYTPNSTSIKPAPYPNHSKKTWGDVLRLDEDCNVPPTDKKIPDPDFFSSLFLGCFGEDRKPKRNPSSGTKPKEVNPTPLVRPPYYSAWM